MATTSKQTHPTGTTKAPPSKATARAAKGTASSSKPMRATAKPGKAATAEPSVSAAAAPVLAPKFLTLGYWLLEKKISVRALAGAINKHGVVTFDDLDVPQHHPVGSSQTEAALDVLRACHAQRQNPEPSYDTGFEQDDHDWPAYRYGWLSTAVPDFAAIEHLSFAMATAKTLGQAAEPQPFTTLYELLSGRLATTVSLDSAIQTHGVSERRVNAQGLIEVVAGQRTPPLAALAAFSAYLDEQESDPLRSFWGPDHPLHTYGWPAGKVPPLALDLKTPGIHRVSEHWQRQLRGMFDKDFTTVGCLLITGRAKPSDIAAAVNRQGIEHRGAHNHPQLATLPYGCNFANVQGPMRRLSQFVHELSQYERARQPMPIKAFQDQSEVLDNWGWSMKQLPQAFTLPVAATVVPAVAPALADSGHVDGNGAAPGATVATVPVAPSKPMAGKTKSGYLGLIGVLLDIIQNKAPVQGFDKALKRYVVRQPGEPISDADLIYTLGLHYAGLKNISRSRYFEILNELKDLDQAVQEIMNEANNTVALSHLTANEKIKLGKNKKKES